MNTVAIIYFSGSGHTAKEVEAVHPGTASVPEVTNHLIAIKGEEIRQ